MDEIYTMKIDSEELAHHGIKGMKWGIRRYQNKDGSLTAKGRKRYLNEDGSLTEEGKKRVAKLDADRRGLTGRKTPFAKSPSSLETDYRKKKMEDMTDDELKKAIARKRSEVEYSRTVEEYAKLNPKPISKGEKFAKLVEEKFLPKVLDKGADIAMDWVKKKLGLGEKDKTGLDAIKEEAEIWKAKGTIAVQKDLVDKRNKRLKEEAEAAKKAKQAKQDVEDAGKTEKESAKKAEGNKETSDNKDSSNGHAKGVKGMKWEKKEHYGPDDYEVFDKKPNSSEKSSSKKNEEKVVYEGEWSEVTNKGQDYSNSSSMSTKSLSSPSVQNSLPAGRDYIAGLLPAPRKEDD